MLLNTQFCWPLYYLRVFAVQHHPLYSHPYLSMPCHSSTPSSCKISQSPTTATSSTLLLSLLMGLERPYDPLLPNHPSLPSNNVASEFTRLQTCLTIPCRSSLAQEKSSSIMIGFLEAFNSFRCSIVSFNLGSMWWKPLQIGPHTKEHPKYQCVSIPFRKMSKSKPGLCKELWYKTCVAFQIEGKDDLKKEEMSGSSAFIPQSSLHCGIWLFVGEPAFAFPFIFKHCRHARNRFGHPNHSTCNCEAKSSICFLKLFTQAWKHINKNGSQSWTHEASVVLDSVFSNSTGSTAV